LAELARNIQDVIYPLFAFEAEGSEAFIRLLISGDSFPVKKAFGAPIQVLANSKWE
jgi:hypothetical protein